MFASRRSQEKIEKMGTGFIFSQLCHVSPHSVCVFLLKQSLGTSENFSQSLPHALLDLFVCSLVLRFHSLYCFLHWVEKACYPASQRWHRLLLSTTSLWHTYTDRGFVILFWAAGNFPSFAAAVTKRAALRNGCLPARSWLSGDGNWYLTFIPIQDFKGKGAFYSHFHIRLFVCPPRLKKRLKLDNCKANMPLHLHEWCMMLPSLKPDIFLLTASHEDLLENKWLGFFDWNCRLGFFSCVFLLIGKGG